MRPTTVGTGNPPGSSKRRVGPRKDRPMMSSQLTRTTTSPTVAELPQQMRNRAVLFALTGLQQGAVFSLHPPSALIGRESTQDVSLADEMVSGRHARITIRSDGAFVEDLESRNGTFVNEHRIEGRSPLTTGDYLRFGGATILKFSMMDGLEEHALATLFELTLRDPLTRLYNRRYFEDRLRSEYSFARRHGTLLALCLIDIDHFKAINDTCGHQMGDAVLKLVASSIERMMLPEDVLARFGGEEFIIIARATSLRNVEILAERIRQRIERLIVTLAGHDLRITVSVGAALTSPEAMAASAEALLTAADRALYRAKAAGRNRVTACTVTSDDLRTGEVRARRTKALSA